MLTETDALIARLGAHIVSLEQALFAVKRELEALKAKDVKDDNPSK
jgi:hypothetical protein